MKHTFSAVGVLLLFAIGASSSVGCNPEPGKFEPGGDPNAAYQVRNSPEEYAWNLFLAINRQALHDRAGVPDPYFPDLSGYDDNQDVVWETWARVTPGAKLASEAFPDNCRFDAWDQLKRPQWSFDAALTSGVGFPLNQHCIANQVKFLDPHNCTDHELKDVLAEESRCNQLAYEYIRNRHLERRSSLADAFGAVAKGCRSAPIRFPDGAKFVKARWTQPFGIDLRTCHWRLAKNINSQPFVLSALHIVTKDSNNWFWATFVHKHFLLPDDPRDPHPQTIGTKWEHYRLLGTQTAFTDAQGVATQLRNSQIEDEGTVSCITCHAYARIGSNGILQGKLIPPNAKSMGVPEPSAFFEDPEHLGRAVLRALPTDFIWAIPLRNHSCTEAPIGNCGN